MKVVLSKMLFGIRGLGRRHLWRRPLRDVIYLDETSFRMASFREKSIMESLLRERLFRENVIEGIINLCVLAIGPCS